MCLHRHPYGACIYFPSSRPHPLRTVLGSAVLTTLADAAAISATKPEPNERRQNLRVAKAKKQTKQLNEQKYKILKCYSQCQQKTVDVLFSTIGTGIVVIIGNPCQRLRLHRTLAQ